jgi:organic radical activating enzyme
MAAIQLSIAPKEIHLNVNEIFGPTIQGEGSHTGERCGFLRLAGCNLSCSWCDTPYSWDWSRYDKAAESHRMSIQEIADQINAMKVKRLIVTGGEPMLQQRAMPELQALTGCKIDIETNGTIAPREETVEAVYLFCVSPKLAHAGDSEAMRFKPDVLNRFRELAEDGKAIFKFVATSVDDFAEIDQFLDAAYISNESVWIMPEGITAEKQLTGLQDLADAVIERGWNVSSRLHVLIWETERAK